MLSEQIDFDPFVLEYNDNPNLLEVLQNINKDFSFGSMAQQLYDAACVATILNTNTEILSYTERQGPLKRTQDTMRKVKHTKPPPHRFCVFMDKKLGKLEAVDSLGASIDLAEINERVMKLEGEKQISAIEHYLVSAQIIRGIDCINLHIKKDEPKR